MIEYTTETSLHLTQVRVSGSVSLLDLVNFVTKARKEPQYGPALNALVVIDESTIFEKLVPESVASFFRRIEGSGGPTAWAIVASNKSHQSLISGASQSFVTKRLKVRVFDDEFPALQWLQSL